ncbi:MAG: PepSY-like domain-containing protein [Bacteroidales bacterium]
MKKIITLLASIAFVFSISACDKDDVMISFGELPSVAREFVAKYFGEDRVLTVEYDKGRKDSEYEVKLTHGAEISFNKKGSWDEISVPDGIDSVLIPEKVLQFVGTNHPGAKVVNMDKGRRFDVELSNDIDIVFDNDYNFIRYED